MSKITYTDKVALNQNPNVQDINKVNATDMNEIKNVVNSNETKVLLAVTDTAPAQCSTGDMYYDTTDDLIYTATGTNTWSSTGVAPTENTIYVVYDTQTAYAYDGNTLISVGGGTGSSDIVMVYPDTATAETKLYIDEEDLSYQGLEIANSYNTSNSMAYSCDYLNDCNTYSETETFTGKYWVDGKKIYRKTAIIPQQTLTKSNNLFSFTAIELGTNLSTIVNIVYDLIESTYYHTNGNCNVFNGNNTSSVNYTFSRYNNVDIRTGSVKINIQAGSSISNTFTISGGHITVEYTKATE